MIEKFDSWTKTQFCNRYFGTRWNLNSSGKISVRGDITIRDFDGKQFPVIFEDTSSNFTIENCRNLETLKGVPNKICEFRIESCHKLLSLEYSPLEVDMYKAQDLNIKDLKGSTQKVNKVFNCANNDHLSSFEGAPSKVPIFYASYCPMITTLFGAPLAESYYVDIIGKNQGNITNPTEIQWIKENDIEMIHIWLKSGLKIEEFLEKKKSMLVGRKYGL